MWYNNIIETIGNTPLVKLNRIAAGMKATVLAKIEYMNPGGSIKDRIALGMVEDAERRGLIKEGGTIIEWTAGNTGIGLAIVCTIKGYKSIFVMPDKVSQEKIDLLRALGSEVVITPTAVKPEDPRSCYSVAEHLSKTIPNSYYPNQFENPYNPKAHFETTGPEIWAQTEGKVTHVVAAMGTGGTVTGIGKFLKSKNPEIKMIATDPVGSIYAEYFRTGHISSETSPYKVEGMGGSKIPHTADFSVIDDVVPVSDKDAFNCGRELSKAEAIFAGGSSGATMYAALQLAKGLDETAVVVAMITDTGARYVSKMYSDTWMKENNLTATHAGGKMGVTAADILGAKKNTKLIFTTPEAPLMDTFEMMKRNEISQVPIISDGVAIGSINENKILSILMGDENAKHGKVVGFMDKSFPVLPAETTIAGLSKEFSRETPAVLISGEDGSLRILTKSDLISAITA
ncbi:MAG: pyridoxal-phosphate dependent enzyme [Rhizobacter sp.]|nr:pyridoxal-phosphate dependent enzyme [Chlorobiales bacterium]